MLVELPAAPCFFVDRCLPPQLVRELQELGLPACGHDDHFDQDTADVAWLHPVGAAKLTILTQDTRIRRNPLERRALEDACVKVFVVHQRGTIAETINLVVQHIHRIISLAESRDGRATMR